MKSLLATFLVVGCAVCLAHKLWLSGAVWVLACLAANHILKHDEKNL